MKKILISLLILGATGALAVGVSRAFFSDQEKSTGNTFTAGSLDLRFQVDGATTEFTDVNGSPLFNANIIPLLADMKPGDKGERTVKLWADNNPSCGKVSVKVTEDKDNSCTGPELIDDPSCIALDTAGELNDQINFAVWADPNCNNILDTAETILTSGTVTENKAYGIGELPITQATAKCYGIAYCFGIWNPTNGTCDGSLVNNAAQTDSFKADLIIDALQKRNQYDGTNGCPVGDWPTIEPTVTPTPESLHVSLENKNSQWSIIPNDNIYGDIQYSNDDNTFNGVVTGTGLVAGGKYQITLNGPSSCTFTDNGLAHLGPNAFSSGYWNNGTNLEPTCGAPGEGIYNMALIGDHYTFVADVNGAFNYPFSLNLPAGSYSGVKVLVKKMLDTHVSPWADTGTGYPAFNLYETAPISFTVL